MREPPTKELERFKFEDHEPTKKPVDPFGLEDDPDTQIAPKRKPPKGKGKGGGKPQPMPYQAEYEEDRGKQQQYQVKSS